MHSLLRFATLAMVLVLAPSALAQDLAPRVFPNPVSDERAVTVEVADAEAATIEVVDILGRRISMETPLAAGTYLVRVRYADGRVTEPRSVTVATPGRVELRLVEALAPDTEASAAPVASAPVPTAANAQGGGCPPGDRLFAGFQHTAFTGSLRLRPDLVPQSMRAQPAPGGNTVDWTTCYGSSQGVSYRFVAGGDVGNRPLRVLSPANVGNTQASFTANYTADGSGATALYGTFEVFLDNDGDGGTPAVPAVQVGFDADFVTTRRAQEASPIANRGGGGYQLLVFNDETLVYETFASESTPLFVTPTGSATRVNLLRSILLSSAVDGFEVDDAGTPPGDIKVAFSFESGDGGAVNVHVGEGAPDAVGTTVHIVPTFGFSDPATFEISDIRTFTTGVNRYGVRAIQFAGGGNDDTILTKGPGFASDAQWGRPQGEYTEPIAYDIASAQEPIMFVTSGGAVEDFGVQFGREPQGLVETGSEVIVLNHGGAIAARGFAGVPVEDDGDFYQGTARVRNETDVQAELITATISNVGGSNTNVLVENANATFSTYEFVFDADADGDGDVRRTGTVGVPLNFSVGEIQVQSSGAGDGDPDDIGTNQDFALAFLITRGGNAGVVYIFPNWDSMNADVDVRSYAVEADEPFFISDVFETDQDGVDELGRVLLRSTAAE